MWAPLSSSLPAFQQQTCHAKHTHKNTPVIIICLCLSFCQPSCQQSVRQWDQWAVCADMCEARGRLAFVKNVTPHVVCVKWQWITTVRNHLLCVFVLQINMLSLTWMTKERLVSNSQRKNTNCTPDSNCQLTDVQCWHEGTVINSVCVLSEQAEHRVWKGSCVVSVSCMKSETVLHTSVKGLYFLSRCEANCSTGVRQEIWLLCAGPESSC